MPTDLLESTCWYELTLQMPYRYIAKDAAYGPFNSQQEVRSKRGDALDRMGDNLGRAACLCGFMATRNRRT